MRVMYDGRGMTGGAVLRGESMNQITWTCHGAGTYAAALPSGHVTAVTWRRGNAHGIEIIWRMYAYIYTPGPKTWPSSPWLRPPTSYTTSCPLGYADKRMPPLFDFDWNDELPPTHA